MKGDAGFSLIELAMSLTLTLVVIGAAVSVVTPGTAAGRVEPEAVDVQQRGRVGLDALVRDLHLAGAGVHVGPAVGSLRRFFAPIVPRRMGLMGPDAFSVARRDAITIAYVADGMTQTTLSSPLPSAAADLMVAPAPNCIPLGMLCGLAPGASLVVFDPEGRFDFFTLTSVLATAGRIRSWQLAHPSFSYPVGAVVAEAAMHTYYFDAGNRQLRHFDGYLTDIPVVDNVVDLNFEYFGEPLPPASPRPPLGSPNCLYDAAGAPQPGLAMLPPLGASLAALPLNMLNDGPWCGAGENRYDADLLRIRRVRVTLRVQAGNEMMRGRTADFVIAGQGLNAGRLVPDYTLRADVSPRNLGGEQ